MLNVKVVVNIYTLFTLPIYYLIQKPKKTLAKAYTIKAQRIDPDKPIWIRNGKRPYHVIEECDTLREGLEKVFTLYPKDKPSLGYREVLAEEVQYDKHGNVIRVDGKILKKYKSSDYKWLTLGQVEDKIDNLRKGFSLNGLKHGEKVAIFADTCVNWLLSSLSLEYIGSIIVTVFTTLGDDGVIYAFNQTQVQTCITSYELLPRMSSLINQMPSLKRIIYFEGPNNMTSSLKFPSHISMISFSKIENCGRETNRELHFEPLHPDDVSMIMYTSGTTGIPKGVIASQRLCKEAGLAMLPVVKDVIEDGPRHTYVAYLPMAHILEASVQMFLFAGGVKIGYATPFTLNESAPGLAEGEVCDLKLLKPTVMTCVPLVLDRFRKEMYNKLRSRTPVSVDIFNYLSSYKIKWKSRGYDTPIVNKILCSKVQQQLGGRLVIIIIIMVI